ncbi:unconventional myosin-XVIIIa isoform X1 [Canis lupus baileyi]|uniref:unconventional myosin-XVIIIa isoform X3 n=1 Tax=Canis lupus familiaris TaxID=9615 RepID=UPI000BA9FFBE|nr:unconventional myosin-XVIIIa isoform X3 [Canis lupus familiaris]XP_038404239.1 unconventional myosin-XVIIIa isoform X3 [Canis lupus familiaris]XP_038533461.1 unconventional myosin-XVIIIa isoform X3 [Canis lupus familiaris]XP_048970767.1 unconventional myosin-XVIIIa isoform X1 [Canis lupus dingo]|eukprot:XP_022279073.1 unconventional myosin-XVIIIa isoform X4 [Canis lupus familiaris]
MFNLMKKDKDKDGGRKEKKEKKEKKERMSAAELRSLEEMSLRRGFFNLNRSSKRESKTRLEISNPIPIKVASSSDLHLTDIDSDSNRGSVILDSGHLSTASSSDDLKGEEGSFRGSVLQRAAKFGSLAKQNSQMIVKRFSFSQRSRDESASETSTPSEHSAAPSPQVEVRTLEGQLAQHPGSGIPRPGPRSRGPELVTKRFPADLRLPPVAHLPPPALRELELQRRPTGDFGFSLRRTTMLDRGPEGQVYRRVVHFAEPGAGTKDLALGLVPGDRLVEINGHNVESKSRDEIVEMIRQSGDSVRLKVQPIPELSELSRSWLRSGEGPRRELANVKEEDKTLLKPGPPGKEEGAPEGSSKDSSGPSRSPQPPTSPVPSETSQRAKSPAPTLAMNGPEAASAESPSEEAQGLSRKRVANAVRKVVSKVLPGEEPGSAKEPSSRGVRSPEHPARGKRGEKAVPGPKPPPPPPPPAPPKPESKKEAAKDELSVGLRSLMSRGRSKDHKARGRQSPGKGEKPSSQEPGPSGKPGSPAKPETPEKQCSPAPPEELAAPGSAGLKSTLTGLQQPKSPASDVQQEAGAIPEVRLTPAEEAQQRLERIFTASLDPEATSPAHSQVGCSCPPLEPSASSGDYPPRLAYTWAGVCARASCWSVKTEEQIAAEEAWYETEKVWLVHKDGFSLGSQLKSEELSLPEGKVRVKLDHDGAILDVDEDDVEKANAPSCDRLEDLASLVYLNESSVLHTLRQRYGASLLHTYAGPSLLVLSPRGAPAVYSEKVMHMFKGCRREDMAPHIYAVAQTAYRAMLMSRQDQSVILLGSSGSGKTTSCQHLVQYLATIAGTSGNKVFSVEKWQALYSLLEAFGNSPTIMNGNATRFSQILSLDFDQAGQVASASIQTMLLEKLRVARRPASEATFNVFYYLLACADGTLRTELHLNHLAENNVFGIVPLAKPEEKQKAAQQFSKLQTAMKVLGISPDEQKACWLILAAIYHLGAAGATKAGRKQFARHEWAQKAAYLLGCSLEELSSAIFKHQHKGCTLQRSTSFRQGPEESSLGDGTGPKLTALECLEGMASGLYSELFTLLVSLVNRALKSSQHSLCSMMIVDTPGFQNPEQGGSARGASFEELCHNYAQDRLQRLFHERTFVQELERYKEENIELAFDDLEPATDDSVAAVDQASHQSLVRSLARTDEARGLLWLLEEEALVPGATEDALLERLFSYYGPQEGDKKGQRPLLRSSKPHHFLLGHSHGTNWVEYNVSGWLSYTKQNPATQNAPRLLQDSQKKIISNLFLGRAGGTTVLSGSIAGLEGGSQLALRRATSMRKTFTTGMAAVKKKSLCIQIKLQVDALIDTIKKSKLHFVHCFLPVAEGWAGEPRSASSRRVSSSSELDLPSGDHCEAGLLQLDVPLLRAQLRGSRLLDAMRMYRQGYPDHMVFSEFRRRFDVLAPHLTKKHGRNYIVMDERRAVEELLESLDLEKSSCCMGLSRVFFRAGTLARLEEQRDEQTSRNLTLFQAACRGYLARQHFKKKKIQDLAIRCVQKNIKKNKGVKDWAWWKLFTTVRPLIEVQLSEEQIRSKDEEIQQLRSKLEKVEKERNELRLSNDRLETRISELTSELTDERNTGESASQLLDAEAAERLRAEKEMKELQTQYDALKKQMEVMEMEVMEARLIRAAEINGEVDDDDTGGEWRLKYERAMREVDFTKKRLQQEFEDKLEVEQQNKRQLERRLGDLQADIDESQRALQQLKKKCQRLTAELQDTKLHLEGQQVRNHELEKKQRRFDSELSQAHEEAQREKLQREKLQREKDTLLAEAFSLKQQLEEKDMDIAGFTQKVVSLEAELQDISSQESKDEASLAKVKKQLRDLEAKVKDQEEELDEQAGTIQMLEQAKLRLEMEMERMRQTHSKEVESRDEEVEEARQSCQKKLKQMEVQLEEEYEDKQKVLREKRELESKLTTLSEQVSQRDLESEKRLRKDLKRTKALLADAQIMLDHLKNNAPSKREIAQLKNQLEESEFTCAAAVKARKAMEVEMEDLHLQIDDIAKAKTALEEQLSRLQREKNEIQSRLEEDQEDMNELMKKHKAAVAQASRDLAQMNDLQAQLEEANKEKQELQEKLQALQSQVEFLEQSMVDKSLVSRQEAKIRELETRLEFERTQVKRLESLASRLKENMEKLTEERDQRTAAENREKEQNKRLQRQLRDTKEEMGELARKEAEASRKKHELEMDLESLEAANQSLQADLKLAFKRIGDLQAAIEDEMESDENEDLITSLQDMVTKYQKRKNKPEGDSDVDSELEDRVDGVKSWLSKNKGPSKAASDDGSLKSSRTALNTSGKEGKGVEERPASALSSLSYRKRLTLKDSIGGTGDEDSLFTTLSERAASPERPPRKTCPGPRDELDERGSTLSEAPSRRTGRGLEKRWGSDFDRASTVSAPTSRASSATRRGSRGSGEDGARSSMSFSLSGSPSSRRSTSRLDTLSVSRTLSPSLSRASGLGRDSPDSHLSLGQSCLDAWDDTASVALSEAHSQYSHPSLARSLSVPPRPRISASVTDEPLGSGIRPASRRSYLDPDLEAAINEVLSYKPVPFQRSSLEPDSEEDDRKSIQSVRSVQLDLPAQATSIRRSASAADVSRAQGGRKGRSRRRSSSSSSSSSEDSSEHKRRKKGRSRKSKKKSKSRRKRTETESESSSTSSGSTVSGHSRSSVKKGPAVEEEEAGQARRQSRKEEKKRKKEVDSLMMRYLYRPESD